MESIFENEWVVTKELLYETVPFRRKRIIYKIVIVACIIYFVLGIISLKELGINILPITYLVGAIALAITYVAVPYFQVTGIIKKNRKKFGTLPVVKCEFFENGFNHLEKNRNNNMSMFYEYTRIKKIEETPNLYVFLMDDKVRMIIKKDSFKKGNDQDFIIFISEKKETHRKS